MTRNSVYGHMEEHLDKPVRNVLQTMQNGILNETTFCGVKTYKSPMDAWVYQEIIWQSKPQIIIEIGTKFGGSTLYLASLLDVCERMERSLGIKSNFGSTIIIGVDIDHSKVSPIVKKSHWRIKWIEGDASLQSTLDQVKKWFPATYQPRTLIIEDSAHTYENTLKVLEMYSSLQAQGDYFIVEDTIANHGLDRSKKWPKGPWDAVTTFTETHSEYEIDRSREHFFLTWNPRGYLRRVE